MRFDAPRRALVSALAATTLLGGGLIASLPSHAAGSGRQTVGVTTQVQAHENWCWVATGLSVIQYFGRGAQATQEDFCRAGLGIPAGTPCPDQTGSMRSVQDAAVSFGAGSGNRTGVISFETVMEQINAGRPMPAGYYYTAGGGHMVAITGYAYEDGRFQQVRINDSYGTHQRQGWFNYTEFVSNTDFRWSETLTHMSAGTRLPTNAPTRPGTWPGARPTRTPSPRPWGNERLTTAEAAGVRAATTDAKTADNVKDLLKGDITISSTPVRVYTLSPDFVAGKSTQPAVDGGLALLATSTSGERGVVTLRTTQGATKVFSANTGDDEVRYAAQADGGQVFKEPQINAWYRLKDGKVTALNDVAKKVVGEGVSLTDYQKLVNTRYGDKMAGSDYQRKGLYGGFNPKH